MLSFTPSLTQNSSAFALFVSEKYEYKDPKKVIPKEISKKIDSFLKLLQEDNFRILGKYVDENTQQLFLQFCS